MSSRPYVPGKYFSGDPCPKGHVAERLVYNEQCVECKKLADRSSNVKASRKYKIATLYGLTEADVSTMKQRQNSKCAICGAALGFHQHTQLDHCHATGKVRGLLCNHCNRLLGCAKDRVDVLQSAIDYLLRNKENNDEQLS